MRIRTSSLLYRLLFAVPYQFSPYALVPARVGFDLTTWAEVRWIGFPK